MTPMETRKPLAPAKVSSVNISTMKGTVKTPVPSIEIDLSGICGDAHAGPWHRQVSLLAMEDIDNFGSKSGKRFHPGDFAENITIEGLDFKQLAYGDRLHIGPVVLEVTQFGKSCHGGGCAIFREVGACVMPHEGLFCRVVKGGTIRPGDELAVACQPLAAHIITLSDRAFEGIYVDKSGPLIEEILTAFFSSRRWRLSCSKFLIADDGTQLKNLLEQSFSARTDLVFTTGGTGIGPRDNTPEVVAPLLHKALPGIMERIRYKYSEQIPSAVLSRSLAGVHDQSLVYVLPGSPRAVRQYLDEIVLSLEHALFMMRGYMGHAS
jgi:molybdenum cofactor synthesis domain-containing protein